MNRYRGEERRKLKKELHEQEMCLRYLHFHNDIEVVYGGGMSEDELRQYGNRLRERISELNRMLQEKESLIND